MIKSVIIDSNGTHNLRWSTNGQVAGARHEQNPSALQPTPTPRIRSNIKPRGYDIGENGKNYGVLRRKMKESFQGDDDDDDDEEDEEVGFGIGITVDVLGGASCREN
ncbi:unnamed protein product [Prunus armeniaca]|uniref:Uncharacterized protein n=1 Tax=Prunus armeniaca TaxID=36596 RepID=A0A6J5XM03_PRUAR|nr:unnamed protein product [Prunus armeniaca]